MRAMAWLAALGLLAVPAVQAQGESHGEWVVPAGPHHLEPELETLSVDLLFRYHCNLSAVDPSLIHVRFSVSHVPSYAVGVLSPISTSQTSMVWEEAWCAADGNFLEFPTTLFLTITRNAPAYVPSSLVVEATVEYGSGPFHTVDGPFGENVTFHATYFPLIQAVATQTRLKVAPGAYATFPVNVTNFGNGPTLVNATWRATGDTELSSVDLPPPLDLESKATHGEGAQHQGDIVVGVPTAKAAIYENEVFGFAVDFTGIHGEGLDTRTDNQTVFLSLQVQGAAAGASAPGLALGLAATLVALIWARRRQ